MSVISVSEVGLWEQLQGSLEMIQEHWLGSFVLNIIGYSVFIVPAAYCVKRWKADVEVQRGK